MKQSSTTPNLGANEIYPQRGWTGDLQHLPMVQAWPTRPPHPMRPFPPSQASLPVSFRPDRPRQPELLWQPEERHTQSVRQRQPQPAGLEQAHLPTPQIQPPALKPYQLKPERGQETLIEPPMEQKEVPPPNAKQIKRMKKS